MTVRCDGSLHAATASRRSTHAGSHICTEKQCNLRCADNHRAAGGGAVGPRDAAGRQHAGGVQALPARRRHQQPARQGHREPGVCAARGRRPAHLPVHGAPLRRIGLGPFLSLRRRLPAPTPIPAQEAPDGADACRAARRQQVMLWPPILVFLNQVSPAASCSSDRLKLHASTAVPCMAAAADRARRVTARDARRARRATALR